MTTSTADFKPEDYSRFFIREFLKKNGFDKTYDMFMQEDTRPKVTMTKNELTRLLGIDQLMRRNAKSKAFQTMLDIISDFLMMSKQASGGVSIPVISNPLVHNDPPKPLAQKKFEPVAHTSTNFFNPSQKPDQQSIMNDSIQSSSKPDYQFKDLPYDSQL